MGHTGVSIPAKYLLLYPRALKTIGWRVYLAVQYLYSRRGGATSRGLGNLRQDFSQCHANGIVRIGVVWVRWSTFSIEIRPFVHPSSPFRIGFADNFLQVIIRGENLLAISAKAMSG